MNHDFLYGSRGDFDFVDLTHPLAHRHACLAGPSALRTAPAFLSRNRRRLLPACAVPQRAYGHAFRCAAAFHSRREVDRRSARATLFRPARDYRRHAIRPRTANSWWGGSSNFEAEHGLLRNWRRGDVFNSVGPLLGAPGRRSSFFKDWPGLSRETSELLVQRGVRMVGSDCLSIDCFSSAAFPAHNTLLGADVLIGENFACLDQLPPWCSLVALPLPIEGGSGRRAGHRSGPAPLIRPKSSCTFRVFSGSRSIRSNAASHLPQRTPG